MSDVKALLVNPPRYYWPYLHEDDSFMLPQALACLSAYLRENSIDVRPVDCMPLKIGWKSLERIIRKEQPDVVGVLGSESAFSHEAARACGLVKDIDKRILTCVGGTHFSNYAEESLKKHPIDIVVRGEGEETLREICEFASKGRKDCKRLDGIFFKNKEGKTIATKPRELIRNLDSLPVPAYDMLPMEKYGSGSRFLYSPGGTTIYHSRGCVHNCEFCVWWRQMAEWKKRGRRYECFPRWRTKSPEKTVDEVELLRKRYRKKYLEFVDDTWNVNRDWNRRFAEEMIERDIDSGWFGFFRADYTVRDEKAGVLKKLYDSGLCRVCIGVERAEDSGLNDIGADRKSMNATREAFMIFRKKYPKVFRQGTFIVGVRDETAESLWSQLDYALELGLDYPGFHPITPVPGIPLWEEANKKGWIETEDFRDFDWMTPVMSSETLSRKQISAEVYKMLKRFASRPSWFLKGISSKGEYKRNMYLWWAFISMRIFADTVRKRTGLQKGYSVNKKPVWYDG